MPAVLSAAAARSGDLRVGAGGCGRLLELLSLVPDPRCRRGVRHAIAVDILAIAAAAVLAGRSAGGMTRRQSLAWLARTSNDERPKALAEAASSCARHTNRQQTPCTSPCGNGRGRQGSSGSLPRAQN